MSSTTNVQSYLPYVFRPVHAYSNGAYSTTFNISNIDALTVGTATINRMNIGDSNLNVYIGNNAGNLPSNATLFATYYNTSIGNSAGAGISNASNSEFIGYLCGNSAKFITNTFVGGAFAAGVGASANSASNIANSVLIGTSNSVGLSNVSNTISIGGNTLGAGSWSVYLGTSNGTSSTGSSNIIIGSASGYGITGSNNLLIGNNLCPTSSTSFTATVAANVVTCTTSTATGVVIGQSVVISGLVPIGFNGTAIVTSTPTSTSFTYSNATTGSLSTSTGAVAVGLAPYTIFNANYNGTTITATTISCNVPATMSNKFFIGSGQTALIAGDFSTGVTAIGTTNTNANSYTYPYTPLGAGTLSLDVVGSVRVQNGISIGRDPGQYQLDVNGQFRVTDGYGQIAMSNMYDGSTNTSGASNASFVEMKSVVGGGSMTLALSGAAVISGQVQSAGYWSLQSGSTGFIYSSTSGAGASNVLSNVIKTNGLMVITLISSSSTIYASANYIVTNKNSGGTLAAVSTIGSSTLVVNTASIVSPPTITFVNSAGSSNDVTYFYNITFFPIG